MKRKTLQSPNKQSKDKQHKINANLSEFLQLNNCDDTNQQPNIFSITYNDNGNNNNNFDPFVKNTLVNTINMSRCLNDDNNNNLDTLYNNTLVNNSLINTTNINSGWHINTEVML